MSRLGIPLEEIHTMIDTLEDGIQRLASHPDTHLVDMSDFAEEAWVLRQLVEDYNARLGINSSLLRRLTSFEGTLGVATLRIGLDRARGFLRSEESEYRGSDDLEDEHQDDGLPEMDVVVPLPAPVAVWTEKWVYVQPRSRAKQIIHELSELIDEVLLLASQANLPDEHAALTAIERRQLIALLETALAMLNAPMVEPGLLKKLRKTAVEVAQSATKKQAEVALGVGLSGLAGLLAKLLGLL